MNGQMEKFVIKIKLLIKIYINFIEMTFFCSYEKEIELIIRFRIAICDYEIGF